jgi:hypothetical protein
VEWHRAGPLSVVEFPCSDVARSNVLSMSQLYGTKPLCIEDKLRSHTAAFRQCQRNSLSSYNTRPAGHNHGSVENMPASKEYMARIGGKGVGVWHTSDDARGCTNPISFHSRSLIYSLATRRRYTCRWFARTEQIKNGGLWRRGAIETTVTHVKLL